MTLSRTSPESGSSLMFILVAVVLFAALTYAISRSDSGAKNLSEERVRLVATEIIDTGNRLAETAARLRLKGTTPDVISLENGAVAGYVNAACTADTCKVFAFAGGGLEWEEPSPDANNGENWGYTGDVAVENIGTTAADLVVFLPNLPLTVCDKINKMLGLPSAPNPPPMEAGGTIDKFTGSYNGIPVSFNNAFLDGQKSGCAKLSTAQGTAIDGAPLANIYAFYQVLLVN
jgi:hypothetical protein